MNDPTSVSLIIPCFERADELQRLLISLEKINFSKPWEVIVVDDGSQNHQKIKMVTDKFQCLLIRLENNLGPSQARNVGAKRSNGEFLWFLDSDAEVNNPRLLTTMVQCLGANEFLTGVGGEMIEKNGKFYARIPRHFPGWIFFVKDMPIDKPFKAYPKFIATSNLLVPKKDFSAINGFSPYFDMHEDHDLCLRLSRSGKHFLIQNDTCAVHHFSPNGRREGRFWFFDKMWSYIWHMHISRVKILFSHFPYFLPILPLLDLIFAPVVFFFQIFFSKIRSTTVFQKRSEGPAQGFLFFTISNLMAMCLIWLMAWGLLFKSLAVGRKAVVEKLK